MLHAMNHGFGKPNHHLPVLLKGGGFAIVNFGSDVKVSSTTLGGVPTFPKVVKIVKSWYMVAKRP